MKTFGVVALVFLLPLAAAQSVESSTQVEVESGDMEFPVDITVKAQQNGTHALTLHDRPGFTIKDNTVTKQLVKGDEAVYRFHVTSKESHVEGKFVFQYTLKINGEVTAQGELKVIFGEKGGFGEFAKNVPGPSLTGVLLCLGGCVLAAARRRY